MNEPPASAPTISVPRTGGMASGETLRRSAALPRTPQPQYTAPLSVLVGAIASFRSGILPALAISFASDLGVLAGLAVGLLIAGGGSVVAYIGWQRLTYVVGENDIRVESGIFSRAARSVPYDRIQDVSLAEPLLARLFGLVAVKFETGAGGGEDISLAYLTTAEGERLRQVVRELRDDAPLQAGLASDDPAKPALREETGETLFAMAPARLLTFGLFEFSLAVFAVLLGLLQYADSFLGFSVWDRDVWEAMLAEQGSQIARLGPSFQLIGATVGLVTVFALGIITGVMRIFSREWGFVLERTPRGFRRRRGLFTRTDVVMPVHRVQALVIGTGLVRYRFGWHSLNIVSLASDNESASHVAAPFARMDEIGPIVQAAGFRLADDDRTQWHHASTAYRTDSAVAGALVFLMIAAAVAIFAPIEFALIPLGAAFVAFAANLFAWEFRRHAIDETQIFATQGVLAPQRQIATRLKLHSAEIVQGPIARLRGYATLNLGLAGGELAIHGLPLDRARQLRRDVLETVATTDFAHI